MFEVKKEELKFTQKKLDVEEIDLGENEDEEVRRESFDVEEFLPKSRCKEGINVKAYLLEFEESQRHLLKRKLFGQFKR